MGKKFNGLLALLLGVLSVSATEEGACATRLVGAFKEDLFVDLVTTQAMWHEFWDALPEQYKAILYDDVAGIWRVTPEEIKQFHFFHNLTCNKLCYEDATLVNPKVWVDGNVTVADEHVVIPGFSSACTFSYTVLDEKSAKVALAPCKIKWLRGYIPTLVSDARYDQVLKEVQVVPSDDAQEKRQKALRFLMTIDAFLASHKGFGARPVTLTSSQNLSDEQVTSLFDQFGYEKREHSWLLPEAQVKNAKSLVKSLCYKQSSLLAERTTQQAFFNYAHAVMPKGNAVLPVELWGNVFKFIFSPSDKIAIARLFADPLISNYAPVRANPALYKLYKAFAHSAASNLQLPERLSQYGMVAYALPSLLAQGLSDLPALSHEKALNNAYSDFKKLLTYHFCLNYAVPLWSKRQISKNKLSDLPALITQAQRLVGPEGLTFGTRFQDLEELDTHRMECDAQGIYHQTDSAIASHAKLTGIRRYWQASETENFKKLYSKSIESTSEERTTALVCAVDALVLKGLHNCAGFRIAYRNDAKLQLNTILQQRNFVRMRVIDSDVTTCNDLPYTEMQASPPKRFAPVTVDEYSSVNCAPVPEHVREVFSHQAAASHQRDNKLVKGLWGLGIVVVAGGVGKAAHVLWRKIKARNDQKQAVVADEIETLLSSQTEAAV
jgi:hypothetical protein